MEFRLARLEDLKQLKIIYKEIIKNMNKNNIQIWDDIYPCEFFEDDINNKRLYVIANDEEIISAFALCDNNAGEAYVEWSEKSAKAMYIDRLGVNVEYSKKGIGQQMLNKAKEISKSLDAEYLRLFVVDINKPAIRLYQKMVSQKLMECMMRCLTMDMFYVKLDMKSSCKINLNLTRC